MLFMQQQNAENKKKAGWGFEEDTLRWFLISFGLMGRKKRIKSGVIPRNLNEEDVSSEDTLHKQQI